MARIANIPGKLVPQAGSSAFVPASLPPVLDWRIDSSECSPTQIGSLAGWPAEAGDYRLFQMG